MLKLLKISCVISVAAWGSAGLNQVWAYERDTHYYMRFALSLATCFNWDEAHIIASGDWGMDENRTTGAEKNPLQTRNKVDWHAFGHRDNRFRDLWMRSITEKDPELRLVKLGQFMHFLEDWESHAGYGVRLGHARDTYFGRDPDSLGRNPQKNHRMIQSALDHLIATCVSLNRLDADTDRERELIVLMRLVIEDGLMESLYETSNPNWKWGKTGFLRPSGRNVLRGNKRRIEEFILDHLKSVPELGVPINFMPGEEFGIPPSLRIPFDSNGEIVGEWGGQSIATRFDSDGQFPDLQINLLDADPVFRDPDETSAGWELEVEITNQGNAPSAASQLDLLVIDSDDETVSANRSETIGKLQPGEKVTKTIAVAIDGQLEMDPIIVASLSAGDLTAMNNADWLMLGGAESRLPELPVVSELDPLPAVPQTITLVEDPRLLVVGSEACVVISALSSGGDTPEVLEPAVFTVLSAKGDHVSLDQATTGRWSALSTRQGLVAAKTFYCAVPNAATREALLDEDTAGSLMLRISIEGQGVKGFSTTIGMEEDFLEELIDLARRLDAG